MMRGLSFAILAAGEGSRLAASGQSLPKPMTRLGGEPMLGRLLRIMKSAGAERVALILNEKDTVSPEWLKQNADGLGVEVDLVRTCTPSSMHSLHVLAPYIKGGRTVVTTVDTVFRQQDFAEYVQRFADSSESLCLMGVTSFIDDEKPLYVKTSSDMKIEAFLDKDDCGECRYVSAGIYGLPAKAFEVLDDCVKDGCSRMRGFQRALVKAGIPLQAFDMHRVIDVDRPSDILQAEKLITEN